MVIGAVLYPDEIPCRLSKIRCRESCGLISLRTPGWSVLQSPNAAVPEMRPVPVCADSGDANRMTVSEAIAVTDAAMIDVAMRVERRKARNIASDLACDMVGDMVCSRQGLADKRRGAVSGSARAAITRRGCAHRPNLHRRASPVTPPALTLRIGCSHPGLGPFYNPLVRLVTRLDR